MYALECSINMLGYLEEPCRQRKFYSVKLGARYLLFPDYSPWQFFSSVHKWYNHILEHTFVFCAHVKTTLGLYVTPCNFFWRNLEWIVNLCNEIFDRPTLSRCICFSASLCQHKLTKTFSLLPNPVKYKEKKGMPIYLT